METSRHCTVTVVQGPAHRTFWGGGWVGGRLWVGVGLRATAASEIIAITALPRVCSIIR